MRSLASARGSAALRDSGAAEPWPGAPAPDGDRIRVLRIISRLIIGGPTLHVAILSQGLDPGRFQQCLVAGRELPGERSMVPELVAQGITPHIVPEIVGESSLGRNDGRALIILRRLITRFRPHVVHTHTGKAGILGRIAARAAGVPVVVHTFHGHVLHGYWGPVKTAAARLVERRLARLSDRLVAVSDEVKRDLVRYGVARPERIIVIPLGLDLDPFLRSESLRGGFRSEIGASPDAPLVGIVGRMVPIKNHRLFVEAARRVLERHPRARFVVVGDGPLRAETEEHARRLGLAPSVTFTGWRRDLPRIYADLDLVIVSSDNEGTPVSAIEAMAAGRPVVATRVGGVPDVIHDGTTGRLVPPGDSGALASAISVMLDDRGAAERMGWLARVAARERFTGERLVSRIDDLYVGLLAAKGHAPTPLVPALPAVPLLPAPRASAGWREPSPGRTVR